MKHVSKHPQAYKGEQLKLKFDSRPGFGFKIVHASHNSGWKPDLTSCVDAWNRQCQKVIVAIAADHCMNASPISIRLEMLEGFEDALKAFHKANAPEMQPDPPAAAPERVAALWLDGDCVRDIVLAASIGADLRNGQEMELSISEWTLYEKKTPEPAAPPETPQRSSPAFASHPPELPPQCPCDPGPGAFRAIAMFAAMLASVADDEPQEPLTLPDPISPACREVLKRAGLFVAADGFTRFMSVDGETLIGIPKKHGEGFAQAVLDAIAANDPGLLAMALFAKGYL
jgi:hypothetical protein